MAKIKVPAWAQTPWAIGAAVVAAAAAVFLGARALDNPDGAPQGDDGGPIAGKADRVLLVGDSLAVGMNGPMKALAADSGIEYRGKAEQGTRIDQWAKSKLQPEIDAFDPSVVLVSLGTNDMKMADPVAAQTPHVQTILQRARDAGARVVWIVPPTMPFEDQGVRQMIVDAKPDGVVRADWLVLPRAGDKIHMTPDGYKQFAAAVWQCVTAADCPPQPLAVTQRVP